MRNDLNQIREKDIALPQEIMFQAQEAVRVGILRVLWRDRKKASVAGKGKEVERSRCQ